MHICTIILLIQQGGKFNITFFYNLIVFNCAATAQYSGFIVRVETVGLLKKIFFIYSNYQFKSHIFFVLSLDPLAINPYSIETNVHLIYQVSANEQLVWVGCPIFLLLSIRTYNQTI